MGPEIIWGLGLGCLAISTILENIPDKYKIRRISKSGILKHKIEISEINHLPLDECLKFGENNEIIQEFYQTLEAKLSHCDLSAFYFNMDGLKINPSSNSFIVKLLDLVSGTVTGGAYFSKSNKIYVDSEPLERNTLKKQVLTHELLHMASSRRDKDFVLSGFHIKGKKADIGEGLNEGYTELLNGRYFGIDRRCDSYFDLQMLAVGIEAIVGQEKMEQAYFSNDLNFLIQEVEKHSSRDEAIELLVKMDSLLARKNRTDSKKATKIANEIRFDIAKIRAKKLKEQMDNGEISEQEYIQAIYAQELYINGYVVFRKKNDALETENNFVANGPLMKFGFVEISPNDFERYANEYYEGFKENGFYKPADWKNKFGITTRKMVEAKFQAKRQARFNEVKKKLNIEMNSSSELGDMFSSKVDDASGEKKQSKR